jgi:hypothetical protein
MVHTPYAGLTFQLRLAEIPLLQQNTKQNEEKETNSALLFSSE